jgi:signal transduction histidine kinase
VYSIVTQSGGTIAVQSRPGLGSVFELRFAAVQAAPARSDSQLPAAPI